MPRGAPAQVLGSIAYQNADLDSLPAQDRDFWSAMAV
jgi:hypothetical protein